MSDATTPLKAIVQRGNLIYTRDYSGETAFVCEALDAALSGWVAWGLSEYHKVPLEVEEPETPRMLGKIEITGSWNDPAFQAMLGIVAERAKADPGADYLDNAPRDNPADLRNLLAGRVIKKG